MDAMSQRTKVNTQMWLTASLSFWENKVYSEFGRELWQPHIDIILRFESFLLYATNSKYD